MTGRLRAAVESFADAVRVTGHGLAGVMPALRSSDGTFGTQLVQARQRARRRAADYPTD